MSKPTIAIIYGFSEGPWHGHRLVPLLERAGYEVVNEASNADVILTHSGGCFEIPRHLRPEQHVIMIAPTYWPGKSLERRALKMTVQIFFSFFQRDEPWFQVWKTAHNLWYLALEPKRNHQISLDARKYSLTDEISHPHTTIVRNHHDPWLTPAVAELQTAYPHIHVVEFPAGHDHCWQHPEPYIRLIQSEIAKE